MKKKQIIDDLEIITDPTPLTKEEEIALNEHIRKLKAKSKKRSSLLLKQNSKNSVTTRASR